MNDKNKESFIEDSAVLFEALGITRMAGRIIGYMLVMEKEMITFSEITEGLKASKSSISTNLHLLMNSNFVVRKTNPGDRKTYYYINQNIDWSEIIARELKSLNIYKMIFNKAYTLRKNKNDRTSQWTQRGTKFLDWINYELNNILENYKETNRKN